MKSETRRQHRSASEEVRLAEVRRKYRSKPHPQELLASGDFEEPVAMATRLAMMRAAAYLKDLRKSSKLTIRGLASQTGLTPAALSRLENGLLDNVTIRTLNKYVLAFGQHVEINFRLVDSKRQADALSGADRGSKSAAKRGNAKSAVRHRRHT